MTAISGHGPMRRRVIKACTACKQSKVRCDAEGKVGKTCSRCRVRGLECEVDAYFKRTPVRERMKAMAAELKELRQNAREDDTSRSRANVNINAGMEMPPNDDAFAYPSPGSSEYPNIMALHPFGLGQDQQDVNIEPTSFGPIIFSVQEIQECFRIFSDHFHPHLPVLNLTMSIGAMQKCSSLLFKTVIVIVCQRFPAMQRTEHDFQLLSDVYEQLLNQSILSGPLSLHTIQAVLLICSWPLPPSHQLAEPSWLYCGVAMNAASYLNLGRSANKPLYQGGQLSLIDVENMSRTWLALFLISTK